MNIKAGFGKTLKFLDDKAPMILTGLAVVGVGATAILTGKAALKVHEVMRDVEFDSLEPSDKHELVVEEIIPAVIPPVAAGLFTVGCVVGAQAKNGARIAALAGAYTLKDQAFADYKEAAEGFLGKKKSQEVHEKVAQKRLTGDPAPNDNYILATGHGDMLCYDLMTGTYFKSDVESIRRAVNTINAQILDDGEATWNDFRYELGLPDVKLGGALGWNVCDDRRLDVDFSAVLIDEKTPVITIEYAVRPIKSMW